jgi:urease accessory protein UreE
MICEAVLGNLYDGSFPATAAAPNDWLDLQWHHCVRRALRACTRGGTQLRILLPVGRSLRHGDVLRRDDTGATVAVNVLPTTVLIARPRDARRGWSIALELGNLHIPVEVTDEEIILLPNGPGEGVLKRHGEPYQNQLRRFAPLRATTSQLATVGANFTTKMASATSRSR